MQRTTSLAQPLATLALAAFAFAASAQTHPVIASPEGTGTVSGHVFCADTNQPARFARVSLEAIADTAASKPAANNTKSKSAPGSFSIGISNSAPASSVETTLDGSFNISKVKPGAYYVVVEKQGYVKPRDIFTRKQMEDPSLEMRALIAAALPRVIVTAGHGEQAEVRLERGAAISGTILYDDGSPASELEVKLLHKDASGKWVAPNDSSNHLVTQTDDRGYFRISSLLGDDYIVQADLVLSEGKTFSTPDSGDRIMEFTLMTNVFTLAFYGSGLPRLSQAAGTKLQAGQELTGQDMTLPISKLHKLTGRVAAGRDAHPVNAAKVSLVSRDDNKELCSAEISRADGLFHFEFIPDGDYILRVTDARDAVWDTPSNSIPDTLTSLASDETERVLATYPGVDQPLLFSGDTLGVTVTIPPDNQPARPTTAQN